MSARLLAPSVFQPSLALRGQKVGFPWLEQLTRFWRAFATRQHLAELDEHMLRDIGVTPAEARREATRLPWDLHR